MMRQYLGPQCQTKDTDMITINKLLTMPADSDMTTSPTEPAVSYNQLEWNGVKTVPTTLSSQYYLIFGNVTTNDGTWYLNSLGMNFVPSLLRNSKKYHRKETSLEAGRDFVRRELGKVNRSLRFGIYTVADNQSLLVC
jgi:aryl-phospho-beta-D-glucosidase BglC (GH1 family)